MIGYQNHKMLKDDVEMIDSRDEEEIIQATREDKTMFVHLYRRYVKDVYRYAFSRLNNSQEAEDITSQTFLSALQSFDQFRGDGCFGAYLIGITRRLIARSFRHKENGWVEEINQLEISKSQSEEQITQKLNLDQVIGELASIPEKRAEAIRLHYFAGLQLKEVAKVMRKSEMAIRMLVHRGIIDLQKRLLNGKKGEQNEITTE